MSADLVPDDLWERIAALLPPRRHRYPGRLPADDRAALRGIVFLLLNGIAAVPGTNLFLITGKLWPRMFKVSFVAK
ncbi:glutaminyl-peptide cyclotransferase [Streptomyces sp. NBC_01643]|uniref:glutaminyl-peptide cyclotransferase n=1 Tax=Streptomyces sp. NBC_01643 TaxID=2975906 RepID=UPI002F914EF6|nr:glutaminyl-peptide cyclotransferase [Streptomyces sp. NBC_01643]